MSKKLFLYSAIYFTVYHKEFRKDGIKSNMQSIKTDKLMNTKRLLTLFLFVSFRVHAVNAKVTKKASINILNYVYNLQIRIDCNVFLYFLELFLGL